jgi:hypothetical protein
MDSTVQALDDRLTELNALNAKWTNPPAEMPPIRLQVAEVVGALTECIGDLVAALHKLDERLAAIETAR